MTRRIGTREPPGATPRRERVLIVNADDAGQSAGINEGVIRAHEEGIVTSASLMVRWPDAVEAGCYARAHPALSFGLHLDLGEWTHGSGEWTAVYEVLTSWDEPCVEHELRTQLERFRKLVGSDPTHLDSHQHVHNDGPARAVVAEMGRVLGIPVRGMHDTITYRGDFYGQSAEGLPIPEAISVTAFIDLLTALAPGVTELGCHPAAVADMRGMYRGERVSELEVLCNERVRRAVADGGIHLLSFDRASARPTRMVPGPGSTSR